MIFNLEATEGKVQLSTGEDVVTYSIVGAVAQNWEILRAATRKHSA
jgi:hypothetical protein